MMKDMKNENTLRSIMIILNIMTKTSRSHFRRLPLRCTLRLTFKGYLSP